MEKFNFGDIVILKFPFTDGENYKRRPALIINDTNDGDIIVYRITSKIYNDTYDIFVKEWADCGLKLPSIVRVHKIATLEKELVEMVIGRINDSLKAKIKGIISKLAG